MTRPLDLVTRSDPGTPEEEPDGLARASARKAHLQGVTCRGGTAASGGTDTDPRAPAGHGTRPLVLTATCILGHCLRGTRAHFTEIVRTRALWF